jgi:hypothetical protein
MYGQLVEDIRTRLKDFLCCSVQHVSRTANNEAGLLAQFALCLPSNVVWIEEYNPLIHNIVITDQLHCFFRF